MLAAAPDAELKATDAIAVIDAKAGPPAPVKDYFGPGVDGVDLGGRREAKSRLQWTCPNALPAGDYTVGLLVTSRTYLGYAEFLTHQIPLYHNDQWVFWQNHSEPVHPEQAADTRHYQAEMTSGVLHLKPGDSLMAVYAPDGDHMVVGPLRLYRTPPTEGVQKLEIPGFGRPMAYWLDGKLLDPQRQGDEVQQGCELYHPGALPRRLNLRVQAVDYLQRVLLDKTETVTLQPDERRTLTWSYTRLDRQRCRFTVTASEAPVPTSTAEAHAWLQPLRLRSLPRGRRNRPAPPDLLPQRRMGDVLRPRRRARGRAAGRREVEEDHRAVAAAEQGRPLRVVPPQLRRPRPCHRRAHRAQLRPGPERGLGLPQRPARGPRVPRLAAVRRWTSPPPIKPGQRNEILVAVRDWIAYSPANQERVKAGEEPVYKDAHDRRGRLSGGGECRPRRPCLACRPARRSRWTMSSSSPASATRS